MGTWGPGNFSDDNALDWLGRLVDELVIDIDKAMIHSELVCGHVLAAQVEVIILLCEQLNAVPPIPDHVAAWRRKYLRKWEAEIDAYDPKPEYKAKRREVIDATFARLAAVAERWHRGKPLGSPDSAPQADRLGSDASVLIAGTGSVAGTRVKFYVQEPPKCEARMIAMNPSDELIASTVFGLEWADITFVVLEKDNGDCFCMSGSFPDGFCADYHEGGKDHVSDWAPESLKEMIAPLQSYQRGDNRWRELLG